MQLEFLFKPNQVRSSDQDTLVLPSRVVPLWFCRNRRARRYILRVQPDGSARVTVPRGGSLGEARSFAERHAAWVEKQLTKRQARPRLPSEWRPDSIILLRGEPTTIQPLPDGRGILIGDQSICADNLAVDLRPIVERHLWRLAAKELAVRTWELARAHQVLIRQVSVRNQRSRWGSCSHQGTISLNWRLVQTPDWVQDYIIIHELMHRREMNHSSRFWRHVERACPLWKEAEKWLKEHESLLERHRRGGL